VLLRLRLPGQKKRVTLGEMMIGQARALFLDEISTGLVSGAQSKEFRLPTSHMHVLTFAPCWFRDRMPPRRSTSRPL
jgi:hypothetical protein